MAHNKIKKEGTPMKLMIKQKVFSWGDKFTVYDEDGNEKYKVEGEVFSLGKKLHVYDLAGTELVFIHQKLLSFMPKFFVTINGKEIAEIKSKLSFKPKYQVDGLNWQVEGNFTGHDYAIYAEDGPVVEIRKEWMTWGDTYGLNIADPLHELPALAIVLAIDAVQEQQKNRTNTNFNND
jgi:uncharacterized protein YxjI